MVVDAQRQHCSFRAGVWCHQVTDSRGEMLYRQGNRDVSSLTTEDGLHPCSWDCCWSVGLHSSVCGASRQPWSRVSSGSPSAIPLGVCRMSSGACLSVLEAVLWAGTPAWVSHPMPSLNTVSPSPFLPSDGCSDSSISDVLLAPRCAKLRAERS